MVNQIIHQNPKRPDNARAKRLSTKTPTNTPFLYSTKSSDPEPSHKCRCRRSAQHSRKPLWIRKDMTNSTMTVNRHYADDSPSAWRVRTSAARRGRASTRRFGSPGRAWRAARGAAPWDEADSRGPLAGTPQHRNSQGFPAPTRGPRNPREAAPWRSLASLSVPGAGFDAPGSIGQRPSRDRRGNWRAASW